MSAIRIRQPTIDPAIEIGSTAIQRNEFLTMLILSLMVVYLDYIVVNILDVPSTLKIRKMEAFGMCIGGYLGLMLLAHI